MIMADLVSDTALLTARDELLAALTASRERCDELLGLLPQTELWHDSAAASFDDTVYNMQGCVTRATTAIDEARRALLLCIGGAHRA